MKREIKQLVAAAVTGSMISIHPQPAPAIPLALAICVGIGATVAVGGVAVIIRNCRIPYYCLWDYDNQLKFTKQTTRRAAAIEGYGYLCGPFDTEREAGDACVSTTNTVPNRVAYVDPVFFIEKSTNQVSWRVAANLTGQDPEDFIWSEINRVDQACFYRIRVGPLPQ